MEPHNVILKALHELRRRQILAIKLNPQTRDLYPDSYAFAISKSIYPLYHEHVGFLENRDDILQKLPFIETYDISREQVDEVVTQLDEAQKNGQRISFRTIENGFYNRPEWNKPWRNLRVDLSDVCRYLFLSDAFSDIWDEFLDGAPSEVKPLKRAWTSDELSLLG
jgi:hypothetical protein